MVVRNPSGRIRPGDTRRATTGGRIRQNDTPRAKFQGGILKSGTPCADFQVPPRNLARPCSDFSCFTRFWFWKSGNLTRGVPDFGGVHFKTAWVVPEKVVVHFKTAQVVPTHVVLHSKTARTVPDSVVGFWGFDTWRLAHSSPTRFPELLKFVFDCSLRQRAERYFPEEGLFCLLLEKILLPEKDSATEERGFRHRTILLPAKDSVAEKRFSVYLLCLRYSVFGLRS